MSGHKGPFRIMPAGQRAALKAATAIIETESGERIADVRCVSDAKLIAAAPELLAALRAFVSLDDGDEPFAWTNSMVFDQARAAIAKAEGK